MLIWTHYKGNGFGNTIRCIMPRSHRACDGLRWAAMVELWTIVRHLGASWNIVEHRRVRPATTYDCVAIVGWKIIFWIFQKMVYDGEHRRPSLERRGTLIRCRMSVLRCRRPSYDHVDNYRLSTRHLRYRRASYQKSGFIMRRRMVILRRLTSSYLSWG